MSDTLVDEVCRRAGAIARAVDAGLSTSRLPRPFRRRLEDAA